MTDSLASTPFSSSPFPSDSDRNTLSSFDSESSKDSNVCSRTSSPGASSPLEAVSAFPFPTPSRDILAKRDVPSPDMATPPLTPDDVDEGGDSLSMKQRSQALQFLSALFPRNALGALPHAKSVQIAAPNTGATFEGIVLDLPGKPKTLYVDGKSAAHVNLRERYIPYHLNSCIRRLTIRQHRGPARPRG